MKTMKWGIIMHPANLDKMHHQMSRVMKQFIIGDEVVIMTSNYIGDVHSINGSSCVIEVPFPNRKEYHRHNVNDVKKCR